MAVPFLQSCNTAVDHADKSVLVTVKKTLSGAGFYGILDNGDKLYPGMMRTSYQQSNDLQRAFVYFSEMDQTMEGYRYVADVFSVVDITTKNILKVSSPEADTLDSGLKITKAWIGGGFVNVEFNVNIDRYNSKYLTVDLQDKQLDNTPAIPEEEGYYPLVMGFKCSPEVMDGAGENVGSIASFYMGDNYSLERLGCKGFEISYKTITMNGEPAETKTIRITPEQPATNL